MARAETAFVEDARYLGIGVISDEAVNFGHETGRELRWIRRGSYWGQWIGALVSLDQN